MSPKDKRKGPNMGDPTVAELNGAIGKLSGIVESLQEQNKVFAQHIRQQTELMTSLAKLGEKVKSLDGHMADVKALHAKVDANALKIGILWSRSQRQWAAILVLAPILGAGLTWLLGLILGD